MTLELTSEFPAVAAIAPSIKAADIESLTRGSLRTIDGYGTMGSKPQPFNYRAAMASFHSWCYAAAMINAKAVASVPLRLYIRSKPRAGMKRVGGWATRQPSRKAKAFLSGRLDHRPHAGVLAKVAEWGDDGFEEVTEPHPILKLLSTFNSDLNGYEASILQLVYMQLCGTAYIMPVLDAAGVPVELWPLPAQHVHWIPGKPGGDRMVEGFTYGVDRNNQIRFEPEEVIPYRLTLDPRRPWFEGMGFVEAAWQAIMLSSSKGEHDRAFYDNYARPDWLLTVTGDYGNEALDRFEAAVERKLQGTRRNGSFLTIPGDVKAQALNIPPIEIGDPARVIEIIAATFGVSVSRLMANQNVAGGQAEVGDRAHLRETVAPLCHVIDEKHNERLLPYWGLDQDAFLAHDDPVPENETIATDLAIKKANAGQLLINEARAADGLDPIRGGDIPRFNGVPLDQMAVSGLPMLPSLPSLPPAANRPTTAQDAPDAGGRITPSPDAGTPQTLPTPGQTQSNADPAEPDVGTVAEATLNGAQITAALDVIGRLRLSEIVAAVAIELLVAVGIPRERATAMADQTAEAARRNPPAPPDQIHEPVPNAGQQSNPDAKTIVSRDRIADGNGQSDDGHSHDIIAAAVGVADDGRPLVGGSGQRPAEKSNGGQDAAAAVGSGLPAEPAAAGPVGGLAGVGLGVGAVQGQGVHANAGRVTGQLDHDCCHEHKAVGNADDHAREDQPDRPEVQIEAAIKGVLRKQADDIMSATDDLVRGLTGKAKDKAEPRALTEREISALEKRIAERLAGYDNELAGAVKPPITRMLSAGHAAGMADPKIAAAMQAASKPAIAFDVTNPDVAKFMDEYTIKLAGRVNATTAADLSRTLAEGLNDGEGVQELAARVKDTFKQADDTRATTIARTESARAYVEGQKDGWDDSGVVKGMKWDLASEACPICSAIAAEFNDKVIPIDGTFMKLGSTLALPGGGVFKVDYQDITGAPAHPNCLLPNTLVSARGVVAALTAYYNGPAIEITTASGRRLSVTANHKLLARDGFAFAHSLRKGDDVISRRAGQRMIAVNPDDDDRPTLIENVVRAFTVSAGVSSVRVPVSAEYLHGDGRRCHGHVHVVTSDRLLADGRKSAMGQHVDQLPLCATWGADTLDRLGDADAMLVALSLSAHGIMSTTGPLQSKLRSGVSHAGVHTFAPAVWGESGVDHSMADSQSADADPLSHCLERFSEFVTLDKIVDVREFNFSGHVYDLQTESGLYIGNGIITSNCRCNVIPVLD